MKNYQKKFTQEERRELRNKQKINEEQKQAAFVRAINAANKSELDDVYISLAGIYYSRFHQSDAYTNQYKIERRKEALAHWEHQREQAREAALEELENIKEGYKFELPEPGGLSTTEAVEKNTEINLLMREFDLINDPVELYFAARYYEDNPALARPVDRLVKARLTELDSKSMITALEEEKQMDLSPLKQTENLIKMIFGSKYGFGEIDGDGNPEAWRSLEDDLVRGEFTESPVDLSGVFNI